MCLNEGGWVGGWIRGRVDGRVKRSCVLSSTEVRRGFLPLNRGMRSLENCLRSIETYWDYLVKSSSSMLRDCLLEKMIMNVTKRRRPGW